MSKKLKVRELKLKKLPRGKYEWIVLIALQHSNRKREDANGTKVTPIRELLQNSAMGSWRFDFIKNYKSNKVYTKVYLVEKMDVALIKMCYADLIRKIYQIKVD